VVFAVGENRFFYRAKGGGTGRAVTFWYISPDLGKSYTASMQELYDGYYYADVTMPATGKYVMDIQENGEHALSEVFLVVSAPGSLYSNSCWSPYLGLGL